MRRFGYPELRLVCAAALSSLLLACGGPHVDVYLVVSSETAGEGEEGGEPVLNLFKAKFRECSYCESVDVELPAGEEVSVRVEPDPRLSLSPEDIEQVRLAEVRSVLDPEIRTWVALAMPSEEARRRLQQLSKEFPFDTALIEIDGKPTDLHSIATWVGGIRLAVFEDKQDLQDFADGLRAPVEWVHFDAEEFERDRKQLLQQFVEQE